jgi:hypothetical protein
MEACFNVSRIWGRRHQKNKRGDGHELIGNMGVISGTRELREKVQTNDDEAMKARNRHDHRV